VRPEEVFPPLRVDVLEPPRGAAVPVPAPPLRERAPCSSDRRGGSNDENGAAPCDDHAELPPESPPELPLEVLPPPALDPPPSPRGAAEPPPPSPRGTAEPVVFPFDVRSCAQATRERGRPATANVTAKVTNLWRVIKRLRDVFANGSLPLLNATGLPAGRARIRPVLHSTPSKAGGSVLFRVRSRHRKETGLGGSRL
jgi:hypothetical protein